MIILVILSIYSEGLIKIGSFILQFWTLVGPVASCLHPPTIFLSDIALFLCKVSVKIISECLLNMPIAALEWQQPPQENYKGLYIENPQLI